MLIVFNGIAKFDVLWEIGFGSFGSRTGSYLRAVDIDMQSELKMLISFVRQTKRIKCI